MALRQMGIANDIVNLAFGLLLGAIAVSVALAFGLGSREIAARELEGWLKGFRSAKEKAHNGRGASLVAQPPVTSRES
jgi:hypothetical protein